MVYLTPRRKDAKGKAKFLGVFAFWREILVVCAGLIAATCAYAEPVPIIFDTDMAGDCDDAGALAVLNALADNGEAEILAVVTNRKNTAYASAAACDVINTYYGRPDIPIGTDKDGAKSKWNKPSPYTPVLRDEYPHDTPSDLECPDALPVYRHTLAKAADNSVTICSVGALSNLEDLLRSTPDEHSDLNGYDLVKAKVKRTVIMGGGFPRTHRPETNLLLDAAAVVTVINEWPGPVIWQGYEVGAALHCGADLKMTPSDNPVRRAFEVRPFLGQSALEDGKPAHDQAAVLIAVRGATTDFWKVVRGGRVVVDSDGNTEWRSDKMRNHAYVAIKDHPKTLTRMIDELMSQPPKR